MTQSTHCKDYGEMVSHKDRDRALTHGPLRTGGEAAFPDVHLIHREPAAPCGAASYPGAVVKIHWAVAPIGSAKRPARAVLGRAASKYGAVSDGDGASWRI
ncbi:hypothetical protein GALLR39Z86_41220 [Glycomyces algeriensis]|uniref:Uncharacterized protein n=1 Tax=Glycomyces algeriensis TaxID=256037 RepID=A0A9W6GCE9_9ACTN|nr:hypothetical protein GALLR39Z86_41220 [Glycomyces algeriensis]